MLEEIQRLENMVDAGILRKYTSDRGGVEYRRKHERLVHPLDEYERAGYITSEQASAGRKLEACYRHSGHLGRASQFGYEDRAHSVGDPWKNYEIGEAFNYAINAIEGTKPRTAAWVVCCYGEKAPMEFGRARMTYLRMALDDLAEHFML